MKVKTTWLPLVLASLLLVDTSFADNALQSTAVYYAPHPPVELLGQFKRVIVEPDNMTLDELKALHQQGSRVYAYVSIGEVNPSRKWYKQVAKTWVLGRNNVWDSEVLDLTQSEWRDFVIKQLVAPLAEKGYDGLFLDTLDSFHLYATNQTERERQTRALAELLQTIHSTYPQLKLIANRGFEVMPAIAAQLEAVVAESLFASWDNAKKQFLPSKPDDSKWLLSKLQSIQKDYHLDIIIIDYVAMANRDKARILAKQISELGFVPWISKPELDGMGVGLIEPTPKEVLVLFDSKVDGQTPLKSTLYQQLQRTNQNDGYQLRFHDIRLGLPQDIIPGRYAKVLVSIPDDRQEDASRVWLKNRIAEGVVLQKVVREEQHAAVN